MTPSDRHARDQTRTYDRRTSVVFLKTQEAFGGLSNMAGGYPLVVNGLHILTSEALYQACRFPHMPAVQRLIIEQRSPMTAKMKSKPFRRQSRPDWDRVRVAVMRWCLRVKLAQNWDNFSELLMETGDRPIVEQSRKDDFWGAKTIDDWTLVGMNVLGRLLMELREAVKYEPHSLSHIEPPAIRDFLLDGRPVGPIETRRRVGSVESVAIHAEHRARGKASTATQASLFGDDRFSAMQVGMASPTGQNSRELRSYPEYGDSGLPWLGRVPAHWEVRRNGRLFAQRNETGYGRLPILEVSLKTGVRVRDMDDLKRKQVMSDREKYKRAVKGDIAYNMMRMWQGAVGVAPEDGLVSPAYVVARPYPEAEPRYFSYLFRTDAYKNEVDGFSRGIVKDRNRLYWEDFKRMPSCFPPPDEQKAIADYLDANAVKVRRFIRNRRRLIEVLNEQKQAIINRAVTRGLDPNAPLKPSGIDWLGDIPEHWNATTLGRLVSTFKTGRFGSILHQSDYIPGGVPLVNPIHMAGGRITPDRNCAVDDATFQRLREYALQEGDIVFSRRGELGRCALVRKEEASWLIGTGSIRARLIPGAVDPAYLIAALQGQWVSDYLSLMSVGATMQSLNTGILSRLPLALPPKEEQEEIPNFIERESRRVDEAIGKAKREIDLIREYRTRLIADVVTGKVDVRGLAPAKPSLDDEQIDEGIDDEDSFDEDVVMAEPADE